MEYFDGLTFSMVGSSPHSVEQVHNEPRYYGIQFNYSGSLFLRIDHGDKIEVNGPCVFLTYPGHYFEYGPPEGAERHHNFICCCGPRIEQYIAGGLWAPDAASPLIAVPHPEKYLHTMHEIMTLVRLPGATSPRAVLMFEDLLLQIHEAAKAESRHIPHQSERLKTLVRQISSAPEKVWDFEAEADKFHVTSIHFRRIFKEITGLPPQQFLIQNRLSKAAELLKSTSEPIKKIAALSGWENVFYFSRLFRQKYYISPLQYRREYHS